MKKMNSTKLQPQEEIENSTPYSITSQQVQKYPPHSEATVKVHLKSIKKGLKYARIPSPRTNNTTATAASTPTIIEEYYSDDYQTPAPNLSTTTPATHNLHHCLNNYVLPLLMTTLLHMIWLNNS